VPNPARFVPIHGSAAPGFALDVMPECAVLFFMSRGMLKLEFICLQFLESSFCIDSAQREGFLSETFHEDAAQADPFYANCKLHTEKSTMK